MKESNQEFIVGIWYAIAAFSAWGFLPLYWKALKQIPSSQIIGHRILWSCFFLFVIIIYQKRLQELKQSLSTWHQRFYLILSTLCLGINWFIYIWAVNAGHVVETSMGYFINPLLNVLLGVVFLKEHLKFWQIVAVILAFFGVLYMTLQYGKLPWIALSLAITFGFYSLLRKTSPAGPVIGLSVETVTLSPLALSYLIFHGTQGTGAFGTVTFFLHALLIGTGIFTIAALLLFISATRRIPLSTIGFIQYLAPSIQLFLGVFVFRETFTKSHLLSFSLIWIALLIYSLSHTSLLQRSALRRLKT